MRPIGKEGVLKFKPLGRQFTELLTLVAKGKYKPTDSVLLDFPTKQTNNLNLDSLGPGWREKKEESEVTMAF